ncbi:MAG: amino acid-binding protein [Chitinivibrionales bacterium]
MVEQVHVFVDNRPGRIQKVTKIVGEAGINLLAIIIQDRGDFGIVKMLVNDPRKARLVLVDAGFACSLKKIMAVEIADRPGGLASFMGILAEKDINVLDAYGFVVEPGKKAVYCIEVADVGEAERFVADYGYNSIGESQLYEMATPG